MRVMVWFLKIGCKSAYGRCAACCIKAPTLVQFRVLAELSSRRALPEMWGLKRVRFSKERHSGLQWIGCLKWRKRLRQMDTQIDNDIQMLWQWTIQYTNIILDIVHRLTLGYSNNRLLYSLFFLANSQNAAWVSFIGDIYTRYGGAWMDW